MDREIPASPASRSTLSSVKVAPSPTSFSVASSSRRSIASRRSCRPAWADRVTDGIEVTEILWTVVISACVAMFATFVVMIVILMALGMGTSIWTDIRDRQEVRWSRHSSW